MKAACLILFGLSTIANANLLLNPGFEANPIAPSTFSVLASGDNTALPNWTVTGACAANCVLVLTNSYTEPGLAFPSHSGLQHLDLTGSNNTLVGGVEQTVSLVAGTSYTLGFWVGNQDNSKGNYALPSTVEVLLDGLSQGMFTNSTSTSGQTNWQHFTLDFTSSVTGSVVVGFRNATPLADNMLGLDDSSLDVSTSAAVPEPATFGVFGAALALLAVLRRKLT